MKKPRLYHTRYLEGYKDGMLALLDIVEHVTEYYDNIDDSDNIPDYKSAIQTIVDLRLKMIGRIESDLN